MTVEIPGAYPYTPPLPYAFSTVARDSTSGSSTMLKLSAERRALLEVGQRVTVQPGTAALRGRKGVITRVGPSRYGDCAVLLDDSSQTLEFYWQELIISRPTPEVEPLAHPEPEVNSQHGRVPID